MLLQVSPFLPLNRAAKLTRPGRRSYTLSEDLQTWVSTPTKGSKAYLDYCTRHQQLEKRLNMCKDGTITKDGTEVKEL